MYVEARLFVCSSYLLFEQQQRRQEQKKLIRTTEKQECYRGSCDRWVRRQPPINPIGSSVFTGKPVVGVINRLLIERDGPRRRELLLLLRIERLLLLLDLFEHVSINDRSLMDRPPIANTEADVRVRFSPRLALANRRVETRRARTHGTIVSPKGGSRNSTYDE